METTRHLVATVMVVNDGRVLLHEHPSIGLWLPPGGHIGRDELPHEAALRECREETGIEPELVSQKGGIGEPGVECLPKPEHFLLEDVCYDDMGDVYHQHIDFVYYGKTDKTEVEPESDDEEPKDVWKWFTEEELTGIDHYIPKNVVDSGCMAIEEISR